MAPKVFISYMLAQSFNWASFDAPDGIRNVAVKDTSEKQINAGRAIKLE